MPLACIISTLRGLFVSRRTAENPMDFSAQPKITLIVFKPQPVVCFNRIKPLILQGIGAHLVSKADAAPLLIEIQKYAVPLLTHLRQCRVQLRPTIAFQAAHQITGKAGRMQAGEHGYCAVGPPDFDGIVFLATILGAKDMQPARL